MKWRVQVTQKPQEAMQSMQSCTALKKSPHSCHLPPDNFHHCPTGFRGYRTISQPRIHSEVQAWDHPPGFHNIDIDDEMLNKSGFIMEEVEVISMSGHIWDQKHTCCPDAHGALTDLPKGTKGDGSLLKDCVEMRRILPSHSMQVSYTYICSTGNVAKTVEGETITVIHHCQ